MAKRYYADSPEVVVFILAHKGESISSIQQGLLDKFGVTVGGRKIRQIWSQDVSVAVA